EPRSKEARRTEAFPVTAALPPASLRLNELLATRDSSLALVLAALTRIADGDGRARFGDLAVAYREEFLRLIEHRRGASAQQSGSLSVDEARTHLGNSVLPRLAVLQLVTFPTGVLWSEAPVAFSPAVWLDVSADRALVLQQLVEIAEHAVAKAEAVSGDHPRVRNASRLEAQHLVKVYK